MKHSCRAYSIKCIIDLHAAPGSQNGMEHSASRDGTTGWPTSADYISQTLDVIEFLASRYISGKILSLKKSNDPRVVGRLLCPRVTTVCPGRLYTMGLTVHIFL